MPSLLARLARLCGCGSGRVAPERTPTGEVLTYSVDRRESLLDAHEASPDLLSSFTKSVRQSRDTGEEQHGVAAEPSWEDLHRITKLLDSNNEVAKGPKPTGHRHAHQPESGLCCMTARQIVRSTRRRTGRGTRR